MWRLYYRVYTYKITYLSILLSSCLIVCFIDDWKIKKFHHVCIWFQVFFSNFNLLLSYFPHASYSLIWIMIYIFAAFCMLNWGGGNWKFISNLVGVVQLQLVALNVIYDDDWVFISIWPIIIHAEYWIEPLTTANLFPTSTTVGFMQNRFYSISSSISFQLILQYLFIFSFVCRFIHLIIIGSGIQNIMKTVKPETIKFNMYIYRASFFVLYFAIKFNSHTVQEKDNQPFWIKQKMISPQKPMDEG